MSTPFHRYLLEPRDPLIARDGRPFGADPGARARSLPFPMPSTVVGGLRTRAGSDETGRFVKTPDDVRRLELRGPLLVQLRRDGSLECLAPAPADALMLDEGTVYRLRPLPAQDGLETDLTDPPRLVGRLDLPDGKPKGMPAFWRWKHLATWLADPNDFHAPPDALGSAGPTGESRTHVAIDPTTGAGKADEGALFSTSGLEFTRAPQRATNQPDERLSRAERLALLLETDADLRPGLAPLAGERRLVRWATTTARLPEPPTGLLERIAADRRCRVLLLTPAAFAAGWKPAWLLEERHGVRARLEAAAVNRPAVVSGWDFEKNHAKPTRRLAPAGSVYFLRLDGADPLAWLEHTWMRNVSDTAQDRLDGFGLAALGTWEDQ